MSRIFTSNYANRNIQKDVVKIKISVSAPKGFIPDDQWLTVAPDWYSLLKPYKDGLIDDKEYTRRYLLQLESQKDRILKEFRTIQAKYDKAVLLCWCGKGKFCHRRLLADWLYENTGTTIQEF